MKDNPHAGHRDRVREEFLQSGFSDATPDHKLLEMLLFYSIPRKDTNVIAHRLLERFNNSLAAVLEAPEEELMKISGISDKSAALIKLILPICRKYRVEKASVGKKLNSIDDICDYLIEKYFGFDKEIFGLTSINGKGAIIAFDMLNSGDVSSVGVSIRTVIETALKRKAVCVVISHNHPGGNALPSNEDIDMTKHIKTALGHIGIPLVDHVIIADSDCVSLAQSEAYHGIFENAPEATCF